MLDHSLLGLKWPKNEIFNISENTFLKIWNVVVIFHDEMILLFCFCRHLNSDLNRKMMTPKKLMRIYQPKFHLVRPFYLHTGPQCQKIWRKYITPIQYISYKIVLSKSSSFWQLDFNIVKLYFNNMIWGKLDIFISQRTLWNLFLVSWTIV